MPNRKRSSTLALRATAHAVLYAIAGLCQRGQPRRQERLRGEVLGAQQRRSTAVLTRLLGGDDVLPAGLPDLCGAFVGPEQAQDGSYWL